MVVAATSQFDLKDHKEHENPSFSYFAAVHKQRGHNIVLIALGAIQALFAGFYIEGRKPFQHLDHIFFIPMYILVAFAGLHQVFLIWALWTDGTPSATAAKWALLLAEPEILANRALKAAFTVAAQHHCEDPTKDFDRDVSWLQKYVASIHVIYLKFGNTFPGMLRKLSMMIRPVCFITVAVLYGIHASGNFSRKHGYSVITLIIIAAVPFALDFLAAIFGACMGTPTASDDDNDPTAGLKKNKDGYAFMPSQSKGKNIELDGSVYGTEFTAGAASRFPHTRYSVPL